MFIPFLSYGVLICREYCCAVYSLDEHLKRRHAMPTLERRALLAAYADFPLALLD